MRTSLVAMAVVTGLAHGCGSSSGAGSIPWDQFADEYANMLCHRAFTCCTAPEREIELPDSIGFLDEMSCRSAISTGFRRDFTDVANGIDMGRIIHDGSKARACLDALKALSCSQWGADPPLEEFPDCLQTLRGTIALGGACTLSDECLDGNCGGSFTTGTCVANAQLGDSCASNECQDPLTCLRDAAGSPTTCAARKPDGMPCGDNQECVSRTCYGTPSAVCSPRTVCNGV